MSDGPFTGAQLPIADGKVYHLAIAPDQLAPDVILVGDPERVPKLAEHFFATIEADVSHRGLCTITGITKQHNHRVSIIASGMGTSSLEIVLGEMAILQEIDFTTRKRKSTRQPLHMIRVGTCGAIQEDTPIGSAVISTFGIGLDNTGKFYDVDVDDTSREIEVQAQALLEKSQQGRFKGKVFPHVAPADELLVKHLVEQAQKISLPHKTGITLTLPGFFAAQGRDVFSSPISVPHMDSCFAPLDVAGHRVENLEMETSFLLHFAKAQGYRAGAICIVLDNRTQEEFLQNYDAYIFQATEAALETLYLARQQ